MASWQPLFYCEKIKNKEKLEREFPFRKDSLPHAVRCSETFPSQTYAYLPVGVAATSALCCQAFSEKSAQIDCRHVGPDHGRM